MGEHWHPEASWRLSCLRIDPKSESWVWRVGELKEKGVPLTRQKGCVTCRPLCSSMTQFCAYWHQVPLQTDNQDSHDNTVTLGTAQYYRYYYERMITHLALQRAVCALHSLQALHGPYSPRFGVPLTFRTGWHDSDRGRRPEGGLPGVFFASPDWDRNDCHEKSLPEMVDRGPIPISAVSTA